MTVKQTLIYYIYLKLTIRNDNTAHYMNMWYKLHTFHNILLKYAHILLIFVMKYNQKCYEIEYCISSEPSFNMHGFMHALHKML